MIYVFLQYVTVCECHIAIKSYLLYLLTYGTKTALHALSMKTPKPFADCRTTCGAESAGDESAIRTSPTPSRSGVARFVAFRNSFFSAFIRNRLRRRVARRCFGGAFTRPVARRRSLLKQSRKHLTQCTLPNTTTRRRKQYGRRCRPPR